MERVWVREWQSRADRVLPLESTFEAPSLPVVSPRSHDVPTAAPSILPVSEGSAGSELCMEIHGECRARKQRPTSVSTAQRTGKLPIERAAFPLSPTPARLRIYPADSHVGAAGELHTRDCYVSRVTYWSTAPPKETGGTRGCNCKAVQGRIKP